MGKGKTYTKTGKAFAKAGPPCPRGGKFGAKRS